MRANKWIPAGVVLMMTGCGILGDNLVDRPGPVEWRTARYSPFNVQLSLELPQDFSSDFPLRRTRTNADIHDPAIYDEFSAIVVDDKNWDYFHFPTLSPVGSLGYTLSVHELPNPIPDPSDLQSVGEAAIADLVRRWEDFNKDRESKDRSWLPMPMPEIAADRGVTRVGETSWFSYRTIDSSPAKSFIFALDESHYVEIRFLFTNNREEKWQERAQRDMRRILESARITQNSK